MTPNTPPSTEGENAYPERSPWLWTPTLYFMQGLPVMMIQSMSVTLYKKMGVPNEQIGLFTSIIAWPWIVKMLWGPLVDTRATKRWWIVTMQAGIIAGLGLVAFSLQLPTFLLVSLAIFFVVAFMSATHDIAADGFYMLSLDERKQAFFVGIRSAAFRLATIFTSGVLVVIAGSMEQQGVAIPWTWTIAILVGVAVYGACFIYGLWALPRPAADSPNPKVEIGKTLGQFGQILFMLVGIALASRLVYMGLGSIVTILQGKGWSTFTPDFGRPLYTEHAGEAYFQTFPLAAEFAVSLLVILLAAGSTRNLFVRIGMGEAAKEFFFQPKIGAILSFILFFRFGESMISKMSAPFLLDPPDKGGLGIDTATQGLITGTVGVIALTIGGLLGGFTIAKFGIKKCFWPMVLSLNIPNLAYVWAAFAKPSLAWVYGLVGIDQFGYGFGFSAYMVYLLFICQGHRMQTALYAIATGLMALGAMIAGIASGYVQSSFAQGDPASSYGNFFIAVCICTIPGMLTLFFIPMDREDIRVAKVEID